MDINNQKVTFLLSFGHTGIDWLHSLFDSHPQILIMPCFSFYRSWKILNADSAETSDAMHDIWINYFNSKGMQSKESRQFYNVEEMERFSSKFLENLVAKGIGRKETFWSIIQSYAWAKNIDFNQISTVIEHEHASFPYKEIFKDFTEPKIIMIYRDPRASIAGFYKGINKKYANWPDIYEYFINMSLEEWMNSCDLFKRYKYQLDNRLKLVKNEELSRNTKQEMLKISKWLQIDYNDSLIKSTYPSGIEWVPDSCYLTKEEYNNIEKFPEPIDKFFDPARVKKRWLDFLKDKRDILMIEFLFNDIMKEFGYKRITPNTILTKLKGFFYYLLPHRGTNRFKYYPADKKEVERVKERLIALDKKISLVIWNIFPVRIQSYLININAILNHLIIYFIPRNRWQRYDNPRTEISYRIIPHKSSEVAES